MLSGAVNLGSDLTDEEIDMMVATPIAKPLEM
jgi:hypothetical protein